MNVQIIADSASDLPLEYFSDNNVILIPLKVHMDNEEFDDLVTINPKVVYDAMRNGKAPKTSQASPQDFYEAFRQLAKDKRQGLYIAFSSELSGTYQTAVMMRDEVKAEFPEFELEIIDSKCASLGLGLAVMEVVRHAANGKSLAELTEIAKFQCSHMEHLFTVADLEYLARGGRISKSSAFIGGLLNIKPLLNVEDGKLIPLEKYRGKKKLMRAVIESMKERGTQLNEQIVGISHGDDMKEALEYKALIEEAFQPKSVYISSVGATVGAHSGPGTIAIFFLNKLPE
ncbi:DegV family protein [Pradoshia sp.]